ncbi:MAG: 30S ribosome-binding factor RbfA [Desulfobacterales bacterium]|nr:30S ribosome-binding factor RbfA [Desulfobacterales bacterium]
MSWNPKTDLFPAARPGHGKRPQRVADVIQREISALLVTRTRDPRLAPVSIVSVVMTRDLKRARINYSVFGDAEQAEKAAAGLAGAKGFIRSHLARTLALRTTPDLQFHRDLSLVHQQKMEKLLKELATDDDTAE